MDEAIYWLKVYGTRSDDYTERVYAWQIVKELDRLTDENERLKAEVKRLRHDFTDGMNQ